MCLEKSSQDVQFCFFISVWCNPSNLFDSLGKRKEPCLENAFSVNIQKALYISSKHRHLLPVWHESEMKNDYTSYWAKFPQTQLNRARGSTEANLLMCVLGCVGRCLMQAGGTTGLTKRLNVRFSSRSRLIYLGVYMWGLHGSRPKHSLAPSGAIQLTTRSSSLTDETGSSVDSHCNSIDRVHHLVATLSDHLS